MARVSCFLNATEDESGRHPGFEGYTRGDKLVRVFEFEVPDASLEHPETVLELAFRISNDPSFDGTEYQNAWISRELRSLSVGDVVSVGEGGYACARAGWEGISSFEEDYTDTFGIHPLRPKTGEGNE